MVRGSDNKFGNNVNGMGADGSNDFLEKRLLKKDRMCFGCLEKLFEWFVFVLVVSLGCGRVGCKMEEGVEGLGILWKWGTGQI